MVKYTAPAAGTIKHARGANPISALLGSIAGVFIGILIILLLAPVLLWFAESQDSAKIFSLSEEVLSTSGATGFIRTTDVATANVAVPCYQNKVSGNCIYYSYVLEELQYTTRDYCGTLSENQKVIETKGQECRRDSNDEEVCEQCYLVNESNWNTVQQEMKFQPFSIGNFKIDYPNSARIIGAETYSNQIDSTHKERMDYIRNGVTLLVAGDSNGVTISDGGDKKYLLVSTLDYQATYETLKAQDVLIGWILRIIAFLALLIGYNMIFGPISVMSNFVRKIPLLGKWIDNAVGGVIFLASLLLAIVHFIIIWVLIMIIKNIIWAALIVGVAGIIFYLYTKFKKSKK
ncbi:MAG: TMEM43 family protein [Candidatus Pacearchaeota archaeon]|nr:TMEM43 family protein [Candidatus Pacearchaeota archaeon]